MKYKIEITGGLLGMKTILEGTLTDENSSLIKELIGEKKLLNLNPNSSTGYKYTFILEFGRKKTQEHLFDDTTLTVSFKELLEIAQVEAKVYQ